jgi:hypothetical protein
MTPAQGVHGHHGAELCYAVLCCAVLCCAVLCYDMLCYAVLCYGRRVGSVPLGYGGFLGTVLAHVLVAEHFG